MSEYERALALLHRMRQERALAWYSAMLAYEKCDFCNRESQGGRHPSCASLVKLGYSGNWSLG